MNSPFILRESMSFARRVRKDAGNNLEQQVKLAWILAYSREPTDEESSDAVAFLKSQTEYFREHPPELVEQAEVPGSRSQFGGPQVFDLLIEAASAAGPEALALAQLCQMLMSSNEFLYVG